MESFNYYGETITFKVYDKVNHKKLTKDINNIFKKFENVNEIEGKALTGEDGFDEILNAFKKLYPGASIVLTCGKKGAYAMVEGDVCYQEIIDYPVVDTTGAGDTFLGFFLSSFLGGESAEKSLLTATKASAIAVSRKGAMSAIPFKAEVL